jgi:DNA-binding GntR family transcriptional regulator
MVPVDKGTAARVPFRGAPLVTFTSKTDLVAATLREMILTGELAPGAPLRQRDLADRLRVSPTPIREALRRLQSEGLVHNDLHKGSTVTEAEQGATEENYQIRAALEALGSSLACRRIADEQLEELDGLNDEMASLPDDDSSTQRYGELNREFHFTIYQAAGSPMLLMLMRLLWQQMHDRPRVLRSHRESAAQHREILTALREGNAETAAALTRAHILGAAHLALHPDLDDREAARSVMTLKGSRRGAAGAVPRTRGASARNGRDKPAPPTASSGKRGRG